MVRRPSVLATLLLAGGCAKILGFDESTAVPCVSSSDCAVGFVCLRDTCQCDGDCPGAGTGGSGGAGGSDAGGEAGGGSPSAGTGGSQTGGAGGTSPTTGGSAGDGGGAGVAAKGGGGNEPGEGGTAGAAGESVGGAGDGGTAGSGTTSECGDGESCLVCDSEGKHVPGETPCDVACHGEGECVWPPSCDGVGPICAGEDCCVSLSVRGGDFLRSCDYSCTQECFDPDTGLDFPADVSSFGLDVFEVTVARFRRFVNQYSAKPTPNSGRNVRNVTDTGWNPDWDQYLPDDATALRAVLEDPGACDGPAMWTVTVGGDDTVGGGDLPYHEAHPMNCVTWFEAQAFCIWDGGRLPTEAEWNFASAGGDQHRYYPWSSPADSTDIDESKAIFKYDSDPPVEPGPVGSLIGGQSRWHHLDLAGNVAEWIWDGHRGCYNPPTECNDCGNPPTGTGRVARGGAFHNTAESVSVETRRPVDGLDRRPWLGFRCLRDF
jgi:sulfatase modifying factor 1